MNRNRVRLRRKLRCNRYDHIGRRVKKITPEATYTCFYDGWLLVKEVVERSGDTRRCGVSPRRRGGAGSSTSLGCDAGWMNQGDAASRRVGVAELEAPTSWERTPLRVGCGWLRSAKLMPQR